MLRGLNNGVISADRSHHRNSIGAGGVRREHGRGVSQLEVPKFLAWTECVVPDELPQRRELCDTGKPKVVPVTATNGSPVNCLRGVLIRGSLDLQGVRPRLCLAISDDKISDFTV